MPDEFVNVRYMVDDVENAVAFYTTHFGFELRSSAAPAFADVIRGHLRLLLSGPASSAGRPMPDGRTPEPGGWNRIHLIVEDLAGEVERLRAAGLTLPQRHRHRARAASRSCSRIPPATRSSSSSPPALMKGLLPPSHMTTRGDDAMALTIGDTAPDFEAQTTEGNISFHDWIGDSWVILFSHPRDFTPVCTTELGYMASIKPEFDKRNVKVVGLSVDPMENHEQWASDIEETQGHRPNYPIIADADFKVSKLYGMLPAET